MRKLIVIAGLFLGTFAVAGTANAATETGCTTPDSYSYSVQAGTNSYMS